MLSAGDRAGLAARNEKAIRNKKMVTRREFLDALAVSAAGLAVGTSAKSYGQILGSNDRVNFAVIGLNGRGYAHLAAIKANKSAARISHVCDVDSNILRKLLTVCSARRASLLRRTKTFAGFLN
jgi:hypothetical protein